MMVKKTSNKLTTKLCITVTASIYHQTDSNLQCDEISIESDINL